MIIRLKFLMVGAPFNGMGDKGKRGKRRGRSKTFSPFILFLISPFFILSLDLNSLIIPQNFPDRKGFPVRRREVGHGIEGGKADHPGRG
jgi:hypothetical protein